MQPTIEIIALVVFSVVFISSFLELFSPKNKAKRKQINDSFREARKQSELIKMPDGSYYCQDKR